MSNIYNSAKYYEIAFSWRDIPNEVDVFEECFHRFSKIPVKSVLEIACGNAPHMQELTSRGYEYTGLDLSESMLQYSKDKAKNAGIQAGFIPGNMVDFSVDSPFDFVYILLGSLRTQTLNEQLSHFNSVSKALKPGGLYLLDWCVQFETPLVQEDSQDWEMEQDGIKVRYTVGWKTISLVDQTFEETQTMDVDDHGKKFAAKESGIVRAIYPQEFLHLVASLKDFEFVGWWNNWILKEPVEEASNIQRPIVVIRRCE